ncbi:hypothetical protein O7623_08055 [Solwaraspora sp. WMMD791]|nr:hypothetical protein [Solwaraspora sp. WMMD791]WFE29127.1 hypothetical protein O7623_08055 [Solwaraspora sp. WMMD791]
MSRTVKRAFEDRWFPSTRRCSACGVLAERMPAAPPWTPGIRRR